MDGIILAAELVLADKFLTLQKERFVIFADCLHSLGEKPRIAPEELMRCPRLAHLEGQVGVQLKVKLVSMSLSSLRVGVWSEDWAL